GGMHQSVRGGFLNVHADFTVHPQHVNWRRRLNVIVYLNQDWKEEYNGHLELWSRDMTRCVKRVTPVFNRWVLFATDDTSFHGHPVPLACPPSLTRKSLALYYYTKETAKLRVRSTEYRGRPGDSLFRRAAIRTSTVALRYYGAMKRRMQGTGDKAETVD